MNEITKHNEKISNLNGTIANLNNEIIILKEDSKNTKEALFNIQIRDVIKAFGKFIQETIITLRKLKKH